MTQVNRGRLLTGRFLCFSLLFLTVLLPARAQTLYRAPAPDQVLTGFGGAVAVGDGEVLIGEPLNNTTAGAVYVFRADDSGDEWTRAARLTASDAATGDHFGNSLQIDGTTMIVGAPQRDGRRGGAYLFQRTTDGTWTEVAQLSVPDAGEGDDYGSAVALSGDLALVGSFAHQENTGAVYAFRRANDGTWTSLGPLPVTDLPAGARFGTTLALDGPRALVGAPREAGNKGAVYVFGFDGTAWTRTTRIEGEGANSRFGSALALQGDVALIGAPRYGGMKGAVFAYSLTDGAPTLQARLEPLQGALVYRRDDMSGMLAEQPEKATFSDARQMFFGTSIAVDGKQVMIGAPGANGFKGTAYVFDHDETAGTWNTNILRLDGEDLQRGDFFGGTLGSRGDVAVVGLSGADFGEGAAVLFRKRANNRGWEMKARLVGDVQGLPSITGELHPCEGDNEVAGFGCHNVDLVSFLSVSELGGGRGVRTNDIWGWTDPQTGKEYALVGRSDGTAFVDISDPFNPVLVGDLPLHEGANPAVWRDIKVYKDHAFIVSDGAGPHGMQVFDLGLLRSASNPPVTFEETAHYDGINSAHNIVINEETGFAYAVGSSMGGETCGGGLHMINIQDPLHPAFAGCFSDPATGRAGTGYSHDAQCVTYHGPDAEHRGKEICFGSNETALSIADVTDKENPIALSKATYPNVGYSHQGWLSEDQHYFYMDDELDELQGKVDGTRTLIWDVSDLDDPQLVKEYISENKSSDHNLYIKGNLMYQSNYTSGLRILDISDPANPVPVGYFDTVPYGEDAPGFGGSWSNYPFFKSGVIIVTSGTEGLFVLKKKDVDI